MMKFTLLRRKNQEECQESKMWWRTTTPHNDSIECQCANGKENTKNRENFD